MSKGGNTNTNGSQVKREKIYVVEILGLLLALIGIGFTFYVSEPANLDVNHSIDKENSRLIIEIENTAFLKPTGQINFFRLDVSNFRPHMQLESLKPHESKTLNLSINIGEITIDKSERACKIPSGKLYFLTEDTSITYKITCDNCYAQGIVKRIPETETIKPIIRLHANGTCEVIHTTYSWTEFTLEDLYKGIS